MDEDLKLGSLDNFYIMEHQGKEIVSAEIEREHPAWAAHPFFTKPEPWEQYEVTDNYDRYYMLPFEEDGKTQEMEDWMINTCVYLNRPDVHLNWLINLDGPPGSGKSGESLYLCEEISKLNKVSFEARFNIIHSGKELLKHLAILVRDRLENPDKETIELLKKPQMQKLLERFSNDPDFEDLPSHKYPPGSIFLIEEAENAFGVAQSAAVGDSIQVLEIIRSLQINVMMNEIFLNDVKRIVHALATFRILVHRRSKDMIKPYCKLWVRYRHDEKIYYLNPQKTHLIGGVFEPMGNPDDFLYPAIFLGNRCSPDLWKDYSEMKPQFQFTKIMQAYKRTSGIAARRAYELGSDIELDRDWET